MTGLKLLVATVLWWRSCFFVSSILLRHLRHLRRRFCRWNGTSDNLVLVLLVIRLKPHVAVRQLLFTGLVGPLLKAAALLLRPLLMGRKNLALPVKDLRYIYLHISLPLPVSLSISLCLSPSLSVSLMKKCENSSVSPFRWPDLCIYTCVCAYIYVCLWVSWWWWLARKGSFKSRVIRCYVCFLTCFD